MSEAVITTNPQKASNNSETSTLIHWLKISLIIVGLTGWVIYVESSQLELGQALNELLSYKLTSYANILLIASAIVYIAFIRIQHNSIAKWATNLATAGVIGLFVALLSRWYESYQVLEEGHAPISNLYEVTVCFTALTVALYLIFERIYRNPSMGAFVLPIAAASVGLQEWLISGGYANQSELVPALKSYWMHSHVLANFIGYGCFAVASGAGVMYLVRDRLEKSGRTTGIITSMPQLKAIDDWIYRSIAIGFPVFTLAVILGAAWAYYAWGSYWSWDPKETWSLIVMFIYAGFLHARFLKGWTGVPMAWWAIIGFGFTMFCFLGVNLFLSGLHSYGAVN